MRGFYWLIDGALAGCPRPGGNAGARGEAAPDEAETLDTDLRWLRGKGIQAILSLTETPLHTEALDRDGFATLHLPVADLHAPTPAQLHYALAFIDAQHVLGRAVAVHCRMGQGRTGTLLAAYRIRADSSVDDALREVRTICPGAIGSPVQEEALHAFARHRDWIL